MIILLGNTMDIIPYHYNLRNSQRHFHMIIITSISYHPYHHNLHVDHMIIIPYHSMLSSSRGRQASGGLRAEIVHLREVRNAVNAMPPEARRSDSCLDDQ